jgi:hypothetical protein
MYDFRRMGCNWLVYEGRWPVLLLPGDEVSGCLNHSSAYHALPTSSSYGVGLVALGRSCTAHLLIIQVNFIFYRATADIRRKCMTLFIILNTRAFIGSFSADDFYMFLTKELVLTINE